MEKKVSVIIPVYGVEKYIEACLDSITHQSYKNLQIIILDDESPDECPAICERYKQRDYRIQLIHQKNRGAAGARNRGLDEVRGEYICFVDSDDVVDLKYVERLVFHLEKNCADIAVCSYQNVFPDKIEPWDGAENALYGTEEYLIKFLNDWSCGLIWNKIFRADILKDIRFKEGHKIDDEFFTYRVVMNSRKIVVFDEELYQYRMRYSGVMLSSERYKERILSDRLDYLTERYELVTAQFPRLKNEYLYNLTDNLIFLWRSSKPYPELHQRVKMFAEKYRKEILLGNISIKMKYAFLMKNKNLPLQEQKEDEKTVLFP